MQEIGKRIGLLRLLLADIQSKQAQLKQTEMQYRAQLSRIVDFVVYRDGDASNALSLMAEVQGKLDEVQQAQRHLGMILERAELELEVLVLTRRVSEARLQLAELEQRQQELSTRLAYLSGSGSPAPVVPLDESVEEEQPSLEPEQVEHIRSIHQEVSEVASEIERLHQLITEASERAALTIQTSSKKAAEMARKREGE